jgi:hypothetical protein
MKKVFETFKEKQHKLNSVNETLFDMEHDEKAYKMTVKQLMDIDDIISNLLKDKKIREMTQKDKMAYVKLTDLIIDELPDLDRKKVEVYVGDLLEQSIKENENINENITFYELKQIEKAADAYFNRLGLDIEFTKHFLDRVNDPRNEGKITAEDLNNIFKEVYKSYGMKLRDLKNDYEAVFKDISTDINSPFIISYDKNDDDINIIMKTIMRKRGFKSSNQVFTVKTN